MSIPAQPASTLAGRRILLAEDTPINQQIVCGLLADSGLLIEVVDNGQQALERFRSMAETPDQRPELILMDIQMPVLDGYQAARQIRALDAEMPIIALTADADAIEKARAAGMNAHLSKPIDIRQLKALLRRFLLQEPRHEQAETSMTEPSMATSADADQRSTLFPEIPGIDRERACLMMDRDPARFLGFLNRFCEDFAGAAAQIRHALAAGEPDRAAQQLHQLRGIAGQLGARTLAQSAVELEHSIQRADQALNISLATSLETPVATFAAQLHDLISASAPWRQRLSAPPPTPESIASTSDARQYQLLIVDDSLLAIELLSSVLADMGRLSIATSGHEALTQAAQTDFDLVLLDACMPELDGFETCALLHRDHPEIPVIFVTAEQDSQSEVRALQAGALDFISKPYNPPVVRARVGVYLTLKAQTDRLRESEARFARAVRGTSDGLWEWQIQTGEAYISPRYKELLGYGETEIDASFDGFQALLHPDDQPRVNRAHQAHLEQQSPFDIEFRLRTKAGDYRWFRSRAQAEWDHNGRPTRMAGAVSDITARKRAEAELLRAKEKAEQANRALQAANAALNQLATTDRLTGVANRRSFETEAEIAIRHAKRFGSALSLLLLDIDHFKLVNDRFGHLLGDQVLIEVTRRAQSRLREVDILARWGGEEFVVLLQHANLKEATKLAERLRVHLAETPLPKVGQVTASFGVAEWRPSENLDQWIKRADDCLYTAKRQGRNQVVS
ncbi:response regulator [Lamprobacter modestohalophilus]|uniref:response regulator n=1 Tax=Lamprobacter modestohalophilus TaxID=1064514 RepID=UPI002ADECA67|nr:response regulator [Lamprobacter modestohalophilus]MEA1050574.1 response regulator [Lamprobacter modestohalophilus]